MLALLTFVAYAAPDVLAQAQTPAQTAGANSAADESRRCVDRGHDWADKREFDKAIEEYVEAIKLDPKNADAFTLRALAWMGKQEFDKAMSDLDASIRLKPDDVRTLFLRATLWREKEKYDNMIRDCDSAIRINPKFARAYHFRGLARLNKLDHEKAIKDFDEAIRIDPSEGVFYYDKACARALQKQTEAAIENLRMSLWYGYEVLDHMQKDPDLDSLRSDPRYLELVKQYDPKNSDAPLPADVIATVKQATVYITVRSAQGESSGSGFVVSVKDDEVLIATNSHVVGQPKAGSSPSEFLKSISNSTITAVFDAGTPQERSGKIEVVAADPENDLAICRVVGVARPPAPLDYSTDAKLWETMTVYSFGFPFGQMLATSSKAPAVTVGKAAVSSLRLGANGALEMVQIDGNLNPGNSGGPLVDRHGRVVGIAVAILKDARRIGFAIPARHLKRDMRSRPGHIQLVEIGTTDGKLAVRAEVGIIDPQKTIRSVTLYVRENQGSEISYRRSVSKQEGAQAVTLKVEGGVASGEFDIASFKGELLAQAVANNDEMFSSAIYNFSRDDLRPNTRIARAERGPAPPVPRPMIGPAPPPPGAGQQERPPEKPVPDVLRTKIIGFPFDKNFEQAGPKGALLVGFEVGLGKFMNIDVVRTLRPIYRVGAAADTMGETFGSAAEQTVRAVAKPGYAVGGVTAKTGLGVNGFSITFMKIAKDKLDPADRYESDWIGDKTGGGPPTFTGGDGKFITGMQCRLNNNNHTSGIGLLVPSPPSDAKIALLKEGKEVEFLPTLLGAFTKQNDGSIKIGPGQRVLTSDQFTPPIAFKIVAQTDSTNIRLAYACNSMIFNWEMRNDEFRIDGGPADKRHKPGAGGIPVKQWVLIELKVMPDSMTIVIDGIERYQTHADFSKINEPLSIFPAFGSTVGVKSIKVSVPKK